MLICRNPKCRICVRRRRQRELMLAGAVGGLVMFVLSALALLLLQALS